MADLNSRDRLVVEIMQRVEWLDSIGFHDSVKFLKSFPKIASCDKETIVRILAFLKANGSRDPVRIVRQSPGVVHLQDDMLAEKLLLFRDIGFKDPMKMVDEFPSFITYAVDRVALRVSEMADRGFSDPWRVIEENPSIPGYKIETLDAFIGNLRQRGFDPVHMLSSAPMILKASIETIDQKIKVFSEAGIPDTIAFCSRYPLMLEYSAEKVARQIAVLKSFTDKWYDLVYGAPMTLRYSETTLRVVLSIVSAYVPLSEIPNLWRYNSIFYVNVGKLAYAHLVLKSDTLEAAHNTAIGLDLSKEAINAALRKVDSPIARLALGIVE